MAELAVFRKTFKQMVSQINYTCEALLLNDAARVARANRERERARCGATESESLDSLKLHLNCRASGQHSRAAPGIDAHAFVLV